MVLLINYAIILTVRDLFKKIVLGIALTITSAAYAGDYKVLVIPDNIVTDNAMIDSFIYNASAEFFADDVINLLNSTQNIDSPSVSEIRELYKQEPTSMIMAKNLTNKFKTSYNIDYVALKKLANRADAKYVLLMTSYTDAENYILRRTPWDILNIPGATVIDPAYKLSTYAVLVDTEKNAKLWSDTYYKTISVCENRIITRGASPQTEQLQKIKDYSKYISPQIAQSVQTNILPPEVLADEKNKIDYGIGDIDNVFTKKYRHVRKESGKLYNQGKDNVVDFTKETKVKIEDSANKIKQSYEEYKEKRIIEKQQKELESKLEVKATPVYENNDENFFNNIKNQTQESLENIKKTVFKKEEASIDYPELIDIEIKKKKKNNLYGEFQTNQPSLRGYN